MESERKPRFDLNTEQGLKAFLEWLFSDDDEAEPEQEPKSD